MWLIIVLGLAIGVIIGSNLPLIIPVYFAKYLSIAILAGLDTIFGGARAYLDKEFDDLVLITGFIFNSLLAAGLAYIGDQLGVALYVAAIFVFGVRLFNNLAIIRRNIIKRPGEGYAAH